MELNLDMERSRRVSFLKPVEEASLIQSGERPAEGLPQKFFWIFETELIAAFGFSGSLAEVGCKAVTSRQQNSLPS